MEIFKNSAGKSKGSSVVIFYDPESALKAISELIVLHVDFWPLSLNGASYFPDVHVPD